MPEKSDRQLPMMWVNQQEWNNVVVLTSDVLYLATVKKADLPRIDLGLEECKHAYELLPAKAWQIPLANITRFQFKQVQSTSAFEEPNRQLTVYYRDQHKERKLKIPVASEAIRDEVVQNLNKRLGTWPIHEVPVSAWLILARYLWIITVFGLMTVFFTWLEVSDYWNRRGASGWSGQAFNEYFDTFGVWGLVVPGALVCVIALMVGIAQLRNPPVIVTYQREDSERT